MDTLSRLFPGARTPEMRKLFEEMKTRHTASIEACERLAESLT